MSAHSAIKDLFGIRIDKFLSSLSDETKRKMWPIVNALRLEFELSGSTTFPVPIDKLRRNRCSDEDAKAVLANLHRQGILSVTVRYKTKYGRDEKFSVQTIDEHPEIYDYPKATISLNKEQLAYLYTKLELFVHPEKLATAKNAIKILHTRNKTGRYSEIDNIVKRVEQECLAIESGTSHRALRDFWLSTKRVLGIICNKLYSGLDGQPKQEISISLDEFYARVSLRQKRVIHETLDNLTNKGVVSAKKPTLDDESIFIQTDGIFYNGYATLVIKNAGYLKDLLHKISTLAEFIEEDGKKRFSLFYPQDNKHRQIELMKKIVKENEKIEKAVEYAFKRRETAQPSIEQEKRAQVTKDVHKKPKAKEIQSIEIKKNDLYYYIVINNEVTHKTIVKASSQNQYWGHICKIAQEGQVELNDSKIGTGILQYFNSTSKNPIYKKGLKSTKVLTYRSDYLYPGDNVKIKPMSESTFRKFFK